MPFNPDSLRAAAENPGWEEAPPAGSYEAELYKAEVFTSREKGETFLRLRWKVLTGRLRDHTWATIHPLDEYKADGSENLGYGITGQILKSVDADLSRVRTTDDLLSAIPLGVFQVEVKQSGQWRNTWPQKRLAEVQTDLPTGGYGQPPAQQSQNAVYQGDDPMTPKSTYPEPTGESDVPGAQPGEFEPPPKQGDIDPATGEPIPF